MFQLAKKTISNNHDINLAAAQIEGWLSTYFLPPFDGSGGIGGPIATYWTSFPYMAGPYVMNSYGLIRGLCARAQDENASAGLKINLIYLEVRKK